MISEQDILTRLRNGEIQFPPLRLDMAAGPLAWAGTGDAFMTGRWGELELPFVVEIKRRVSLKVLREVAGALKAAAAMTQTFPLLVADWLAPEQLKALEQLEVSGIDLNGNGVIVVPEKFFASRSGAPNQYRESVPLRNPYRGESAMVARVFLLRPEFQKVEDVWREIQARGGRLSLASVSKALKVLDEDLMITRREKKLRVLQPDRLLDRLVAEYQPPTVVKRWLGNLRTEGTPINLPSFIGMRASTIKEAAGFDESESAEPAVLTGASSVDRYATMGREPVWSYYVQEPIPALIAELASWTEIKETSLFANVELLEVEANWPGFDARLDERLASRIWASPLQTYLELSNGDQRQRQTAEGMRKVAATKGWSYSD